MPLPNSIINIIQGLLTSLKEDGTVTLDLIGSDLTEKDVRPLLAGIVKYPELRLGLHGINFSHNFIKDLSNLDVLTEFTHLNTINLSNNEIVKVPDFFGKITALENLDLSYNKLNFFPDLGLSKLNNLNLQGNRLLVSPKISGFPKLKNLNIEHNAVCNFDMYDDYKNIEILHMQAGNFFDPEILKQLKDLRGSQSKAKAGKRTSRSEWSTLLQNKKIATLSMVKDGYDADSEGSLTPKIKPL